MKEFLHNCLNNASFLRELLQNMFLLLTLLLCASCTGMEDRAEVNIKVYTSMDREFPVVMKINRDILLHEMLKPHREMYKCVKVFPRAEDYLTIYHSVGDRDTTFTFWGAKKVNYMSITYSKMRDAFLVNAQDSAAFHSEDEN